MSTTIERPFSWSYSALKNFETCPRRYYHYQIKKDVVEPQSAELQSGHQLHGAFEARVKEGKQLPLGYGQYEDMLATFINAPGTTYAEQRLALTSEFKPSAYFGNDVWFRTVIDAAKVRTEDGFALIIDWKSGKPKDDTTQLQLMAATMLLHDPKLQVVRASLAFVGHKIWETEEYTRDDLRRIWGDILPRVNELKEARAMGNYPAKPGGLCRRYCVVKTCPYNGR